MRTAPAVELDRLDGADLVDGAHRRADDRAAGLDRQPRLGDPERAALVLDDLAHLGGQLRRVGRVVLGGVGDAEAAAEVHLGQGDAELVGDPGLQRPAPGGRPPRTRRSRRSGDPMWECRPSSSRPGAASIRRTASNASPLVIEKPNFWSSWAVAMYSWVCASTPAVTRTMTRVAAAELGGDRRQPVDLDEGVDDDPADADLDRAAQLGGASCCCRGSRSGPGRSPPARRPSARRPSRRRG